jgi:signal transduction histidine kinase
VLEKSSLADVIAETSHLFQVTARSSLIVVHVVNILPEPTSEWIGYPGALSQVLMNLLSNVQRYAYPDGVGGRVEITLGPDTHNSDGGYCIMVRDFGHGIAPQNLPRIFEPFFTTGRGKGGSGLGMSIVHTIVTAQMKGAIAITSTLGEGTTVTLNLPREVPQPTTKDQTRIPGKT